jgi:MFS family permease
MAAQPRGSRLGGGPALLRLAGSPRLLRLGLASAGLLLAALDAYAVVTLLPQMLDSIDLSINDIQAATPILSGFLGGYVVAMPLLGAFSDVRGRLPAYAASMAAFGAGSALTALSGSLVVMVVGRTLQGLGGGALVPLTLALAADLFPAGRRAGPIGAVSAVQEAGSVFGPIYGTWLAGLLGGWRGVFWLNLPLGAAILGGLWLVERRPAAAASAAGAGGAAEAPEPRSRVDWLGAGLLGLGLGLLVFALYPDDPNQRPVNALAVPAGVGAAVALALFTWSQRRLAPLVAAGLARSRVFWSSMVANLLTGVALIVALVDVPLLARAAFGLDTAGSGLLLSRLLLGVPVGALAGGWLSGRLGRRWTAAGGILVASGAFVLMSTWSVDELQSAPLAAWLELLAAGIGFGLVIAPLSSAVLDLTVGSEHGVASSLVVLSRTVGMVIGLSGLTAFGLARFHAIFASRHCGLGGPAGAGLRDRLAAFEACSKAALAQEYREIFLVAAVVCAVTALICAWGLGGSKTAPREAAPA